MRTMTIECRVEADRRVQSRLRRARTWLGVTLFVHGSTFVLVLLTAAGGSVRRPGGAVVITHRSRLLPVYDPHGFAEVIRARISSAGEGGER